MTSTCSPVAFLTQVFATLRREAPCWWQEPSPHTPDGVGFWVLSRHADIAAAAADCGSLLL